MQHKHGRLSTSSVGSEAGSKNTQERIRRVQCLTSTVNYSYNYKAEPHVRKTSRYQRNNERKIRPFRDPSRHTYKDEQSDTKRQSHTTIKGHLGHVHLFFTCNIKEHHIHDMDNPTKCRGQQQTVGAGVVPMSICPSTGVAHLLLGQERYVRGWSGSNKVSGFEGGNKNMETAEQNAARECHEETLGLVYTSTEHCLRELTKGEFVMKIAIGSRTKTHITYLTLVPWVKDIRLRFKEIRAFLLEMDMLASRFNCAIRRVRANPIDTDDVPEDGWTLSRVAYACRMNARRVRTKLEHKLNISPYRDHPAISVIRDTNGLIQRVTVNTDYLEKVEVRYVPVHSAIEMLHLRQSTIRPCFRPVLAAICANISFQQSSCGQRRESIQRPRAHTRPTERPPCDKEEKTGVTEQGTIIHATKTILHTNS